MNELKDFSSSHYKKQILRLIYDYLNRHEFQETALKLMKEAGTLSSLEDAPQLRAELRESIRKGTWAEGHALLKKLTQGQRNFKMYLYLLRKQEYLEFLDRQEYQKAFQFLQKRLKPLEQVGRRLNAEDFDHLCYLLTCRSVREAPSYSDWDIHDAREQLADRLCRGVEARADARPDAEAVVPEGRLEILLGQAIRHQISEAKVGGLNFSDVRSLYRDVEKAAVPIEEGTMYRGDDTNGDGVKCVTFAGPADEWIVAGVSTTDVGVWHVARSTKTPKDDENKTMPTTMTLRGHTARVWDLSSSKDLVASASGDETVRLWSLRDAAAAIDAKRTDRCVGIFKAKRDMYAVAFGPEGRQLCAGGFARDARLYDVEHRREILQFVGHEASVTSVAFDPRNRNIVASASKDTSVRIWDSLSGKAVQRFSHVSEVTSVSLSGSANYLLTSSQDNAHRVWDTRTARVVCRLRGHENTSRSFIRSAFGGADESFVVSGSENGCVFVWDLTNERLIKRIDAHSKSVVFQAAWSHRRNLIAACDSNGFVRTWA